MITFETIELGFDIATAISIIGAAAVFIYTTSRENKTRLQNEKVEEILDLLGQFREEHLDVQSKMINKKGNIGPLLTEMQKFLRVEMLPVFAIFATQESIDALENMINETEIAIGAWGDFCDADKDNNANDTVSEMMSKYVNNMIDLDVQITENLRNQVHNENEKTSKKIAEWYKTRKYTYRVVEFK